MEIKDIIIILIIAVAGWLFIDMVSDFKSTFAQAKIEAKECRKKCLPHATAIRSYCVCDLSTEVKE